MPVAVGLAPLVVVVQPIRPDVAPSAVDLGALAVPRLEQRSGLGPVVGRAPRVERLCRADAEGVGDLVERGPLVHVRPVGSEPDVSVEVAVGRLNAGDVLGRDLLVGAGGEPVVAGHRQLDGRLDAGVGVGLVRGWVGTLLDPVGDGRRADGGVHPRHGEEYETHLVPRGHRKSAREDGKQVWSLIYEAKKREAWKRIGFNPL